MTNLYIALGSMGGCLILTIALVLLLGKFTKVFKINVYGLVFSSIFAPAFSFGAYALADWFCHLDLPLIILSTVFSYIAFFFYFLSFFYPTFGKENGVLKLTYTIIGTVFAFALGGVLSPGIFVHTYFMFILFGAQFAMFFVWYIYWAAIEEELNENLKVGIVMASAGLVLLIFGTFLIFVFNRVWAVCFAPYSVGFVLFFGGCFGAIGADKRIVTKKGLGEKER